MSLWQYLRSRSDDVLILCGLLIRCLLINKHNLWFDENVSLIIAQFPLGELFKNAAYDNHPPLYFILIKLFSFITNDPLLLRFSSVIIGTITLWILYKFVSQLINRRVGLVTLILFSLSPLHIYYSTELRMYELLTLEGLLLIWFLYNYLETEKSKYLIYYHLTAIVFLYTHYFSVIFLITLGAIILFFYKQFFLK